MGKLKVRNKNQMLTISVKTERKEQIDGNLVQWFTQSNVHGFIPFEVSGKNDKYTVTYLATGFLTLKEYLKQPVSRQDFMILLDSLVGTMMILPDYNLSYGNVFVDMQTILVNPISKRASILYYPVAGYQNHKYFNLFLMELLKHVTPADPADVEYIMDLKMRLGQNAPVTWKVITDYIHKWMPKQSASEAWKQNGLTAAQQRNKNSARLQNTGVHSEHLKNEATQKKDTKNKCPQCGFENSLTAKFCVKCGNLLQVNDQIVQQESQPVSEQILPKENPSVNDDLYDIQETTVLSEELDEEESETTVLAPEPQRITAWLIRTSTGEKVLLDKDRFQVGKSRVCDYTVMGNNAVSRTHADFIYEKEAFYIIDLDSTNRTYVNGLAIEPQTKVKLESQDQIRLGNEDFTFTCE